MTRSARGRFTTLMAYLVPALVAAGCGAPPPPADPVAGQTWDEILRQARGQTMRMAMWDGDPAINAYMREYVVPRVEEAHGITLQLVGGQGPELVSKLLVDLEAGRTEGDIDLMWINGETFYQLRTIGALYGPFTERLPNNRYLDWENPFVAFDFQRPVEGYECPWGTVQFILICDSARVAEPPRTKEALAEWVKRNPGRFTFDNSFTGMTFLKSLLYDFAGGPESLSGPFDEETYRAAATRLWAYLRELKPYFWRQGKTYPEGTAQLHQLFSNGEVDFTMSNNDGEVDNKVLEGVLPESSRGYVLETGTIRNSHYLGIPANAPHKAAAMVLANFLISPEAQWTKATPRVWGDGTVLSLDRLPDEWRSKFAQLEGRRRVASRAELEKAALKEPSSELMTRLHADFRREIIEQEP